MFMTRFELGTLQIQKTMFTAPAILLINNINGKKRYSCPRHEVYGEQTHTIVPLILNLGTARTTRRSCRWLGWVGRKAALDVSDRRKISCFYWDSNPAPSNP